MHAVYEVARENLAHLPRESSDLGSVPASSRILRWRQLDLPHVYHISYLSLLRTPTLSFSFSFSPLVEDRFSRRGEEVSDFSCATPYAHVIHIVSKITPLKRCAQRPRMHGCSVSGRILAHLSLVARNTVSNCVFVQDIVEHVLKLALPSHHKQVGYTTAALAKNS